MSVIRHLAATLILASLVSGCSGAGSLNGFDLSDSLIPADQIESGGPGKDGIPAIDHPVFVRAANAGFLKDGDRVLGISVGGSARAYPISILVWHETVNDRFGERRLLVTYCPLCGTGMAFEAKVDDRHLDFGVSGLLYNSDMLLYDRQTDSLWSQILGQAISGPLKGARLTLLPLTHTTWEDWRQRHPQTQVLSTNTGFRRDYGRDPYAGYADNPSIWFSVAHRDSRLHPKELVLGLEADGVFRAYPFSELEKSPLPVSDSLNSQAIRVEFDAEHRSATALDTEGREIPSVVSFWFAWFAFHPDTEVFQAPSRRNSGLE